MLAAQGCDPNVVRRDRGSRFFEFHANRSVRRGGCLVHIEDPEVPKAIRLAIARTVGGRAIGERHIEILPKQ